MKARINPLSGAQMKAIREECKRQFDDMIAGYNRQAALQMLHILYFKFDFTEDDLRLFADELTAMQREAVNRYEISDEEVPDVCEIHLRNAGINIDEILGGELNDRFKNNRTRN